MRADDAPGLVPVQAAPVVVVNGCHGAAVAAASEEAKAKEAAAAAAARVPRADDGPEAEAAGRVLDDVLSWAFEAGSHHDG